MSHIMLRCVLVGLLAIFGAACGLPLDGHGNPGGETSPGEHPTGPGGSPGPQAEGGSGVTSNVDAGTPTPEAAAPDSGAQGDAADDGSDSDASDADDGSDGDDGGDQGGGKGGGRDGGKGSDLRFGAH